MLEEDIKSMKKEVQNIENETKSFALELVQELKKRSKRDFITIIVLISLLFISNIAWILYINQYDFTSESIEQYQEDTNNSYMNGEIK